ncbi:MAG TPA: hypothetical protein VIV11_26455, partial [Kofleriaceae bacterium]
MHMRVPPPLVCAIALAAVIALCGRAPRTVPGAAQPDDRGDDRIAGVIGGPLVRTDHGIGAPLDAGDTTVWVWSDAKLEPGQRVIATGRLRTPRGLLVPGASDKAALVASRGAEWEMTARHVTVTGEDDAIASQIWRWADRTQREWAARIRIVDNSPI